MGRGKEKKGGKSPAEGADHGSTIPRIFEGFDVVDRLLARAGAEVDGRALVQRFADAIEQGKNPPQVIPGLFRKEPRFGGPEDALRLYGNLFGIWDRLVAGADPEELLQLVSPPPKVEAEVEIPRASPMIELPPRGSVEGSEVPYEVVEGTWQLLSELPPRERTRRQDRYGNLQSELSEWARTADGLSGLGQELLEFLCFELAEMFDHAFDTRFKGVSFRSLQAATPEDADRLQPYAADWVSETLDETEEDEEDLVHEERLLVESFARRAIVAMTGAVRSS